LYKKVTIYITITVEKLIFLI